MNYRITLAYDGSEYDGWQIQPHRPSIQGRLNEALKKFEGAPVATHAAGRTDAGVHAEGQVVSFRLDREWSGRTLVRALNGNLPQDIRALDASPAAENFHARIDAKSKTYCYQIYTAEVMSPFLARYAWHYPYCLDLERLVDDSGGLLGVHDFTAFTVAGCKDNAMHNVPETG